MLFAYLYRGCDFYLYLAPDLPTEYEESCIVSADFVRQHTAFPLTRPIQFTPKDVSYHVLDRKLRCTVRGE